MANITRIKLEKIMQLVLKEANNLREAAGFQGSMSDNGASYLFDQVKFYRYGMLLTVPQEWERYSEEAEKIADPEYQEYMRLKRKFDR